MLIDDVRARLKERLSSLGVTATQKAIKDRLVAVGLSEKYLDQILVSRKVDSLPIEPTLTKLEKIAEALNLSLAWLLLGIGKPESIFEPKRDSAPVHGLNAAASARRAKTPTTSSKPSRIQK